MACWPFIPNLFLSILVLMDLLKDLQDHKLKMTNGKVKMRLYEWFSNTLLPCHKKIFCDCIPAAGDI